MDCSSGVALLHSFILGAHRPLRHRTRPQAPV